ncbi:MAG: zf-HC2 domain-containing protein [Ignavibacteriales bacterium]|nr:zf-HC2 domain-containing protein [Ignavibacteriales bacterium]
MNCTEVQLLLNDILDGTLPLGQQKSVELHLKDCAACRQELAALRSVLDKASALPVSIDPPRDLWEGIDARLGPQKILAGPFSTRWEPPRSANTNLSTEVVKSMGSSLRIKRSFAAAAALVVGLGCFWFASKSSTPAWQVARLEGTPRIDSEALENTGTIRVGEQLVTDDGSRAKITVGAIGQVNVEPNSRLRLLEAKMTNHRLALEQGTIHARIWAPPRLFFVETPSATAIDLGCEYLLTVDEEGASVLHVTSGWVALEHGGRESIVPSGAMCITRPGRGPGTPFEEDTPEKLRKALEQFDFEDGGSSALSTVMTEARAADAMTLWILVFRAGLADRGKVYDRLVALVSEPEGVTREGVLDGNARMIAAWQRHLHLDFKEWWRVWQ